MQSGSGPEGPGGGQRWAWTHTHAVPLFVASLVAVVLAGSGLVAVLIFDRGGTADGGGDPDPRDGDCLVGTWQMVAYVEDLPGGLGVMQLTGEGPTYAFRADGTGVADYGSGSGTTLQGRSLGEVVTAQVTGELTYRYQAQEGTFRFLEVDSDATFRVDILGSQVEEEYLVSTDPVSYQCEGDTARFQQDEEGYASELHRLPA